MSHRPILLYGFQPFLHYEQNITEQIAHYLRSDSGVMTHIFPVQFDQWMFVQKIKEVNPAAVLGLGQDSRARKIRIERKAVNLRKDVDEAEARPIAANGPEALFCTTYPRDLDGTTITHDAGQYVCNFSMYTCLEYCKPRGLDYMFLHVPVSIDPEQAAKTIRSVIQHLQRQSLLK